MIKTLPFSITLMSIMFLSMSLWGQQKPQYSLYMLNPHNFNPSYAGLDNSLSFTGVLRKQWVGIEGSPLTQSLNAHLPWYYASSAIGLNIENDLVGLERNTQVGLSYAYQREMWGGKISAGLGAGIIQKAIDGSKLRAPDGTYEGMTVEHNDAILPTTKESAIVPTFNVGVFYKSNTIQAGLSIDNITETAASYSFEDVTKVRYSRNYFFTFAYKLEFGDKFALQPSVLVKSNLTEMQIDFSTIFYYNDNIFGGVSFRGYDKNTVDALALLAGMKVTKNITIAYAYDASLSALRSYNSGSHEILINYNFNKIIGGEKPTKIIYNPRLL